MEGAEASGWDLGVDDAKQRSEGRSTPPFPTCDISATSTASGRAIWGGVSGRRRGAVVVVGGQLFPLRTAISVEKGADGARRGNGLPSAEPRPAGP